MIAPQVQEKKKGVQAALVTGICCAVLYAVLVVTGLPEAPPPQDVFTEVNFELMPRFEPAPEEEPEELIDEAEEAPFEEETPEPVEAEPESTPEKVQLDLENLFPSGLEADIITPSNAAEQPERALGGSQERTPQRIELEAGGELGGFDALKGLESPTVASAKGKPGAGAAGQPGVKIDLAEGAGDLPGSAGTGGDLLAGGDVLGGPQGRSSTAGESTVEVGMKELDAFGENYASVDFKALAEWMKQNPAELPVAVKQRMQRGNWDESLLSSRVTFTIGDRSFDLLLMCKEALFEVHIMLVESSAVTYLIDRSFTQESNQLVTGAVTRGTDRDISVIGSRMRPASDQRNKEFYTIFLSWWESAKAEMDV